MLLLTDLQAALKALGLQCVLARNHRLVLRYNEASCEPSGLTEPVLHIFIQDGTAIATTDGHAYHVSGGRHYSACDSGAVAADIVRGHRATPVTYPAGDSATAPA